MNFKICIIGKIKDKHHKAAIKEYQKRLSRYCKIKLVECKDLKDMKNQISASTYVIQAGTRGDTLSSETLSEQINRLGVTGKSDITILHTDESIECDDTWTLSRMNLTSGMFAIVMHEQIYRGYRILRNEPYHK